MTDAPVIKARGTEFNTPAGVGPGGEQRALIWRGWAESMDRDTGTLRGDWSGSSVAGRFLAAMKVGNYQSAAAQWAGVGAKTITKWLEKGREHLPENEDYGQIDLAEIDPEWRPYVWLVVQCRQAEGHAEVELVTMWRNAAREDWRAARDLLARRHKDHWMDRQGTELSGPGGGAVVMAAIPPAEMARRIAENPEARRLSAELLASVAGSMPAGQAPEEDAVAVADRFTPVEVIMDDDAAE